MEGASFTLNATEIHAIAPPISTQTGRSPASDSTMRGGLIVAPTLNGSGAGTERVASAGNEAEFCVVGALAHRDYKGIGSQYVAENKCQMTDGLPRRLTPLECERLQGFPDGWTAIDHAADSARYRALGNAVAVPVVERMGRRLMNYTATRSGASSARPDARKGRTRACSP
jgi:site-specific DNA-cytosine methylase